jgi:hypothetical protein
MRDGPGSTYSLAHNTSGFTDQSSLSTDAEHDTSIRDSPGDTYLRNIPIPAHNTSIQDGQEHGTNGVLLHNTPIYTHTALMQVGLHYGNTGKLSHNTLNQAQTTSIEDGLHCGASGTLSHNIPIQTHTTTPLLGQQVDLKVLHGFKAYQCIERSLLGLEGMMGKM